MSRLTGTLFGIMSATLFGLGGILSQPLLDSHTLTPQQIVLLRLLIGGILLLLYRNLFFKQARKNTKKIWIHWKVVTRIAIYGIAGLCTAQIAFFSSISFSNAAVATVFQSTSPFILLVLTALKSKRIPGPLAGLSLISALMGIGLIVESGLKAGSINPEAIAFGLIAAIGVILYTDLPVPLLKQFAAIDVLGWALVIGGATALLGTPLPNLSNFSKIQLLVIAIVVVLSTVVAYDLYLESLKLIDGFLATMTGLFEPISSVFLGILFLHQALVPKILLGILLVIGAIILLNLPSRTPASIPTKIHPCAMTRDHSRIS
ncbi:EamA family transporter [Levilactobacillus brevis]|uniref:EamA family transporter n=1 Tax=Levilactobacillus brevis TaxID=1580 RepID=UPI000B3F9FF8|nr:DMT family transporter [Levilactobacillus brevis]